VGKCKIGKEERKMGDAPRIASTRLHLSKLDPMWGDAWIDVRRGLGTTERLAQDNALAVERQHQLRVADAIRQGEPVPPRDDNWYRADAAYYCAFCVPNGTNITENPETGESVPSDPTDPDFFLGLPNYVGRAVQAHYEYQQGEGLRKRIAGESFTGPRAVS
jgi:hypothetical protein